MTTNYTPAQLQAAAESLGFANVALMLEYFRQQVLNAGLYEALRGE